MARLCFQELTVSNGADKRLNGVSAAVSTGELAVLVGPNGAGKTTLLKSALGVLTNTSGSVQLDEQEIATMSPLQRAKSISYLPQARPLAWPVLVRDTVALGRYAYGASPGKLSPADEAAIAAAMTACDIKHLANRRTDQLSGGELARVHCARAFAATTPILLADEPAAALDPRHQLRIMALIRSYVDDCGCALVVMHDLNLAARFADRMIWIKGGMIKADGDVETTLTPKQIADVFDVTAEIEVRGGKPMVSIMESL